MGALAESRAEAGADMTRARGLVKRTNTPMQQLMLNRSACVDALADSGARAEMTRVHAVLLKEPTY